ncbi:hypothetical protein MPSEU_000231700 [Mayamaea pseudoterrestris]|nr:hypothetical protein MPSEU_000231700 [Mayamaea pseudoterrestris]
MKTKKRSREPYVAPAPPTVGDQVENDTSRQTRRAKQSRASVHLSHDTRNTKSALKLKLHRTRLERLVSSLKQRLQSWDPVAEEERSVAEAKQRAVELEQSQADYVKPKKRGRLGPESWKLRGAARPASEMYDFDVRYVDPHLQAHERAKEKSQRVMNLLAMAKLSKQQGSSKSFLDYSGDVGRKYLAHLMQLAHVSQEMKHFKTARECFLDCLELDTDGITTAREDLMRMYIGLKRTDAALRLGERLEHDESVWIRYSHALLVHQATPTEAEPLLVRAIQANPFCAYYLAFYDTFFNVMEYTEELEGADDVPQSSLEEAIEYCASEASEQWISSKAADELQRLLLQARKGSHSTLKSSMIDWEKRLEEIEAQCEAIAAEADVDDEIIKDKSQSVEGETSADKDEASPDSGDDDGEDDLEEDDDEMSPVDVRMYAGMFRTAMEMLDESGRLK